jgi:hypothetical protein
LEKELEATLNSQKKTIIFTAKPISQIIVISNSEGEVGVGLQPVVQEQPQLVFESKLMEEK